MHPHILFIIACAFWIAGGVFFNLATWEFFVLQRRYPQAATYLMVGIVLANFGNIAEMQRILEIRKY